jgi:hypothetical protein
MSDEANLVSSYFASNPTATPQQVATAVQSIGGLTPALSSALANYYGTSTDNIGQQYQALTAPAPVAPLSVPSSSAPASAPPAPATPQNNPLASTNNAVDLSGFRTASQVLSGLQSGALTESQAQQALGYVASTPMGTSSGALPSYVNASVAPAPLSLAPQTADSIWHDSSTDFKDAYDTIQTGKSTIQTYKVDDGEGNISEYTGLMDASGNLINNTIKNLGNNIWQIPVSSTGGTMNIFVYADPKTGKVTPVADPSKQVIYGAGNAGSWGKGVVKDLGPIPAVFATITGNPELIPYLNAGTTAINGGNLGDIGKSFVLGNVASSLGSLAGDVVGGATGSSILSGGAQNLVSSEISSGGKADPLKAFIYGGVGSAVPLIAGEIEGYQDLTKSEQSIVNNAIAGVLSGQKPSQIAINMAVASAKATVQNFKDTQAEQDAIDKGLDVKSTGVGIPAGVASTIASLSPDQLNASSNNSFLNQANRVSANLSNSDSVLQPGYGNTVTTTAGLGTDQNPTGTPFTKSEAYNKAYEKLIANGMSAEEADRLAQITAGASSGSYSNSGGGPFKVDVQGGGVSWTADTAQAEGKDLSALIPPGYRLMTMAEVKDAEAKELIASQNNMPLDPSQRLYSVKLDDGTGKTSAYLTPTGGPTSTAHTVDTNPSQNPLTFNGQVVAIPPSGLTGDSSNATESGINIWGSGNGSTINGAPSFAGGDSTSTSTRTIGTGGSNGNTPVTGTSEPQITTDPNTGIITAVEDVNGSKVTNITYPNSNNTKQISENADGTRQETTSDGVNKTIREYDADGSLISESTVPVKPTDGKGDENIQTITVIGRPDPTIAIPSGGTPSTTVTTPVVPTAPVVPPTRPTPPAPAVVAQSPAPAVVAPALVNPVASVSNTPISVPSTPVAPIAKTPTPTVSGGSLPTNMPTNFGGHTPNPIVESLLKTYMTKQAFKDPLASLEKLVQAQQKSEKDMIDPRLASILQQRSAPKDSGYYKYGQEPTSVEDILSLKDSANQTYKTGGHVQPLAHASGGALPVVNNRHDFRHGAHVAGEGDGTSDDIPAMLADGEFVFPADVVSALGNGSTKAGTDKLYEMMHSIRARARKAHPSDLPQDALKSPLDYLKGRKK